MNSAVIGTDAWALAVEPRSWQVSALTKWQAERRGIAAVVTGAGKTVFAEMCMLSYKALVPDGQYVIVVPTVALMDQWYVSLREDLGVSEKEIGTYSGEGMPAKPTLINLMVLNTARHKAPEMALRSDTFLIVDECHRAASPVNALALRGPYVATLGLSATPERQYDSGFEEVLVPALGPIITRYGYNDALRDGVISPFELINVSIELQRGEREEYAKLTRRIAVLVKRLRSGEHVDEPLKRLLRTRAAVSASAAMRIPTAVKLVEQNRNARTIVFHERIDAAEAIQSLLQSRKMNATLYHSKIGPAIRRDNLRLFRKGLFDVLVSCRALDEGTNVPETTVAVIASSTASVRQRIQRLGRVLRPAPGKSRATIYTIYATDIEEERLAHEALSLTDADAVSWQRVSLRSDG